jgi:hypothetical protein
LYPRRGIHRYESHDSKWTTRIRSALCPNRYGHSTTGLGIGGRDPNNTVSNLIPSIPIGWPDPIPPKQHPSFNPRRPNPDQRSTRHLPNPLPKYRTAAVRQHRAAAQHAGDERLGAPVCHSLIRILIHDARTIAHRLGSHTVDRRGQGDSAAVHSDIAAAIVLHRAIIGTQVTLLPYGRHNHLPSYTAKLTTHLEGSTTV